MAKKDRRNKDRPGYVETPFGIVTAGGNWFHTTREQIESIAPQIFEHCSLQELILAAEEWVKSTDSLSLLLYFVLCLILPPVPSALLVLLFFGFWFTQKSALATSYLTTVLRWINKDGTLIITAGIFLSWMGMTNQFIALGIGIVYYFLFKLGLLRWAIQTLFRKYRKGLPLNDRLLKMLILKYAIRYGIEVPEINQMDRQIRDLLLKQQKD
jgi:hypothetical protein